MKTTEERREYQRLYRIRHKERLREYAAQESVRRKTKAYLQTYEASPARIAYRASVRVEANEKVKIAAKKRRAAAKAKKELTK